MHDHQTSLHAAYSAAYCQCLTLTGILAHTLVIITLLTLRLFLAPRPIEITRDRQGDITITRDITDITSDVVVFFLPGDVVISPENHHENCG